MKTLLRSYYVLQVSTTLLLRPTSSYDIHHFFKDVVKTWLNLRGYKINDFMFVGFCFKSHIKMVSVLVGWLPQMQTCLDLQYNKRKNIGSALVQQDSA